MGSTAMTKWNVLVVCLLASPTLALAQAPRSPAPAAAKCPSRGAGEAAGAAGKPAAGGYSGLGAESISPQEVARLGRRRSSRAASRPHPGDAGRPRRRRAAALTPKGDRMMFTCEGHRHARQMWRQDGPMRRSRCSSPAARITQRAGRRSRPTTRWAVVERDRRRRRRTPALYLHADRRRAAADDPAHGRGVQTFHELISDDGRRLYYRANDIDPASYAIYRYDRTAGKRETVSSTTPGPWSIAGPPRQHAWLLVKAPWHQRSARSTSYEPGDQDARRRPSASGEKDQVSRRAYGANDGPALAVLTNKLADFAPHLPEWNAARSATGPKARAVHPGR